MSNSRFDIIAAAQKACRLVKNERQYLAAIGFLPLVMYAVTGYFIFLADGSEKNTFLENRLLEIPSLVVTGWFMFLQTRLIVFGERAERLPSDTAFVAERRQMMQSSVLVWLLLNVVIFSFIAYFDATRKISEAGGPDTYGIIALVLLGVMIWGVRFGVAHILAAVGYSLKQFIYRVNGAGISFRLMALYLLVNLPIMIFQLSVTDSLSDGTGALNGLAKAGVLLTYSFLSLISVSLTNAACVYALREILGREKRTI